MNTLPLMTATPGDSSRIVLVHWWKPTYRWRYWTTGKMQAVFLILGYNKVVLKPWAAEFLHHSLRPTGLFQLQFRALKGDWCLIIVAEIKSNFSAELLRWGKNKSSGWKYIVSFYLIIVRKSPKFPVRWRVFVKFFLGCFSWWAHRRTEVDRTSKPLWA